MEKRSSLFYFGLILQLFLEIVSFGVGTVGIKNFIIHNESISLFTEFLVSFLGAFMFIMSYFIGAFVIPILPKRLGWAVVAYLIWGILLIAFSVLIIVNHDHPIQPLWLALVNYSLAGWALASTSNRFRTMVKT